MPAVQPTRERGSSRGRQRGARIGTSLSEINVVPLVDVMLVMLVIFMVTAPMMQRGLDVNLPEARRADQLSSERLFVSIPLAFRSDQIVQVGNDPVSIEILSERMQQELVDRPGKSVFLRGDGGITYQELMSVIDQLKEGGVEEVGLVASMPRVTAAR